MACTEMAWPILSHICPIYFQPLLCISLSVHSITFVWLSADPYFSTQCKPISYIRCTRTSWYISSIRWYVVYGTMVLSYLSARLCKLWQGYYIFFPSTKMFRISFVKRSQMRENRETWIMMNLSLCHILMQYAEKLWECMRTILSIIVSAQQELKSRYPPASVTWRTWGPYIRFPKFRIYQWITALERTLFFLCLLPSLD